MCSVSKQNAVSIRDGVSRNEILETIFRRQNAPKTEEEKRKAYTIIRAEGD